MADPKTQVSPPPPGLDEFVTDEPSMVAPATGQQAPVSSAPPGLESFIAPEMKQAKYGTPTQIAKTIGEGALKGLLGPAGTGLELAAGVKPEDIKGREEENPIAHGVSEVGTFIGSALTGTGEAGLLSKAGKALEAEAGLSKATRISQMGNEALKGAFEGALYQGGEELHKNFLNDPQQSWESALTNIGISTVLSGGLSAGAGALMKPEMGTFVSELDRPAVEAGGLEATINASDVMKPHEKTRILDAIKLNKEKATAPEIRAAAKELGAPLVDGMTLESPLVQTQLDALIHSPYSVSGKAVRDNFDRAYNVADQTLQQAISSGATESKAELGQSLKDSLTGKIRQEYAPIKQVYDELAATHGIVPIEHDLAADLSKQLREIPEFRVSPSSPQGQLVKQIFNDIANVKTASDLKILKDGLSLPATASSQERRMVGILRDKLSDIEETAVNKFAKNFAKNDEAGAYVQSLIDTKKAISPLYKEFIGKVSTLSEQLGKGKVHGTEDALRFLNERLTPEEVAGKLFSKKDSEFVKFFQKNFPEQFDAVRNYQRAELRDLATKPDTGFSAKTFFNKFNKLEPEMQKALYSADEIKKITAAESYIQHAFPKAFNPSGTAHTMAMRDAFESPKGMLLANVRDTAMSSVISHAARSAEGKQAIALAQATVKGEQLVNKSIKNIFKINGEMPAALVPSIANRAKLDKLVTQMMADPQKMVAMNDNNTSVPEYTSASAQSAAQVVQYLSSVKPNTDPKLPLDSRRPANSIETAKYNRALDIAQQPLTVLKAIRDGRMTPNDVIALRTMYPALYKTLATKIQQQIVDQTAKGDAIPYSTRMGVSMFLGTPLDSTMTPNGIVSAQTSMMRGAQKQPAPDQVASKPPGAANMKGMQKLPAGAQTQTQARETSRATGKH